MGNYDPKGPPGGPAPLAPPVPQPQFPYMPGPLPPYSPGPGDPNYYGPGTEPPPAGQGTGIDVTAPYPTQPGSPPGGGIPSLPSPPIGVAPIPPPPPSTGTGPPPDSPENKDPEKDPRLPFNPNGFPFDLKGGGGDGGGGGGGVTFADPGNLPFIPNFAAPAPGGDYQPTPFTPNYTPWGSSDYRGGMTRPGHVVTPDPFSQMGDGPPAVAGDGGGGGAPGGGMGGPGGPPGAGMFNPNDPYNVYLSSVPVMEREAQRQVQNRVAQIAPGNRFSTASQRIAADVGSETALKQNQMFNELMYNHAQRNEDRALQSSLAGMGFAGADADRMQRGEQIAGQFNSQDLDRMLQAANAGTLLGRTQEDISGGRLRDLLGAGQYETDRMTKLNLLPYEEFINSRKGYLPELVQSATSQGSGSQPSPFSTTTPGKPGLIDIGISTAPIWAPWVAGLGPMGMGAK